MSHTTTQQENTMSNYDHLSRWMETTACRDAIGSQTDYAYKAGFLCSTLAHALDSLAEHDPARAKQLLERFPINQQETTLDKVFTSWGW
jgi:hypothetical protein